MSSYAWTTQNEIDFVKKIDMHSKTSITDVVVLLERYIKAANKRKRWGMAEHKKVIAYAKRRLSGIMTSRRQR